METPKFVHLHLHTDYSLLDGACDLEEVVEEASRRKMPAVAVTDHGNLFAAESFYSAATTIWFCSAKMPKATAIWSSWSQPDTWKAFITSPESITTCWQRTARD